MTESSVTPPSETRPSWRETWRSLWDRRVLSLLFLGFAAGLPTEAGESRLATPRVICR